MKKNKVYKINSQFKKDQNQILKFINNFSSLGTVFIQGNRNAIKLFELGNITLNIKSFKSPNLINKVVYKYFRKSKAQRSFEYAQMLLENNIKTPAPVAFFENSNLVGIKDSYYASEHLNCDFTFRALDELPNPERDEIIMQFTQFTFSMHQKGIEFLDHSPGNTLIKKVADNKYDFYLVDLNRMRFHKDMPFEVRMKNFARITNDIEIVKVIANEYSILAKLDESKVFNAVWNNINLFQEHFLRKKRIKKRLKFWKKD